MQDRGGGKRLRERPSGFGFDAGFDQSDGRAGFLESALLGQPARRFGNFAADEPDSDRAQRSEKNYPAPSRHAERRSRDQDKRGQRDAGGGRELERLIWSEGAATNAPRSELGNVGVDGYDLDADAKAGKKAP